METLCVHAGFGPTRPSQSVGAMLAHLIPGMPVVWVTGTSGTCTSIFKPIFLGGAGLPTGQIAETLGLTIQPTGNYNPNTLWWFHERLHRQVIQDYATRISVYREERDALEATFLREAEEIISYYRDVSPEERAESLRAFTASCFERAQHATKRWIETVTSTPVRHRPPVFFSIAWKRFNREARFT